MTGTPELILHNGRSIFQNKPGNLPVNMASIHRELSPVQVESGEPAEGAGTRGGKSRNVTEESPERHREGDSV